MMQLKELLPSWYTGIVETDLLMNIEQDLLEELVEQLQRVQDNQYITTADEHTIGLYEQMLNIESNVYDSLEVRRFRVLTRMTSNVPYTEKYLRELLESLGGAVEIAIFYNEYRLWAKASFAFEGQMKEFDYLLRSIVPANVIIDVQNQLQQIEMKSELFLGSTIVITETVNIM